MNGLPDDVGELKMMVLAERARAERYEHILKLISRTTFGKRSEKLPADQLALGLEDQGIALAEAEGLNELSLEMAEGAAGKRRRREPGTPRPSLPQLSLFC